MNMFDANKSNNYHFCTMYNVLVENLPDDVIILHFFIIDVYRTL